MIDNTAQDYFLFFLRVNPERVKTGSFVVGKNERVLWDNSARDAAAVIKQYGGQFTPSDRIHPQTYDYENQRGRLDTTNMVLYLTVLETWEDNNLKMVNGIPCPPLQMRNTGFAAYLVDKESSLYHFIQWEGHPMLGLEYHSNTGVVEFLDIKRIARQIYLITDQYNAEA